MRKFSTLKPWTGTLAKLMSFQEGASLTVLHLFPVYEKQLFKNEQQLLIIYPSRWLLTRCDTSFPSFKFKSNLFSSWWHSTGHLSLKKCCSRKFLPPIIHSRGLRGITLWQVKAQHTDPRRCVPGKATAGHSEYTALQSAKSSNIRGETVSSQSTYPRKKTVYPTENTMFLSPKWNKTIVHVPPSEIMTFLCQQKWTWPSNCTAGNSRLIVQRAQPTGWYYIGHFLKNHILLTIHWEVHCSSLDF